MVARSENLDRSVESTVDNNEKLDRTVQDTAENNEKLDRTAEKSEKRDRWVDNENLDRKVEDTAANCLMLISRVGGNGGDIESRVYRCKTCMKEFSSFQSLGGHRASHNKPVNKMSDEQSSGTIVKKKTTTRSHRCPICGLDFPMGQALGGHMRKHRNEDDASGALVTRSFFPETTLKKSSSGKRVACFGLDSDSMETGTINLKLELGRTIY